VTDRVIAVLARPMPSLPAALVAAMLEDVVDLVTGTPMVTPALAVADGFEVAARGVTWPGTQVVKVAAAATVAAVLGGLSHSGAPAIAVVAPDVPDLPTLLLGKLFSALAGPHGADVAVCPASVAGGAAGGGLVAVAATVPMVDWLAGSPVCLDDLDALQALRAVAPGGRLSVGPGWHRITERGDLDDLDWGLEGWDATRAYLEAQNSR
jgi:hypothetical protein